MRRSSLTLRPLVELRCARARPHFTAIGAALLLALAASGAAAASGADNEQLARAQSYEYGEGLPKDQLLAAALYCEAARAGNSEAAFRLGWMYANGRGVAHDDGTASALFGVAARQGHVHARVMLERLKDLHGALPDCMRPPPSRREVLELAESEADGEAGWDPLADLPPHKQKIADIVNRIAPRYGIDPRLALAVIAVESDFNVFARSVKDARGLMQLVPETATRFNVRNSFDVSENVRGGLSYLRWLLAYYKGHLALAAAAYNAGEGTVDRYRGVPPYRETREYVRRVVRLFRSERHPFDPRVVDPSSIVKAADQAR